MVLKKGQVKKTPQTELWVICLQRLGWLRYSLSCVPPSNWESFSVSKGLQVQWPCTYSRSLFSAACLGPLRSSKKKGIFTETCRSGCFKVALKKVPVRQLKRFQIKILIEIKRKIHLHFSIHEQRKLIVLRSGLWIAT